MKKTILVIRHGESAANAGQATPSPVSIPLTEKGLKQAELLAQYFSAPQSLIIASPYLRAEQTSKPLIQRFENAQVETWDVQEFTYLSRSRCGLSTIEDRKPFVQEYWQRCDPNYCDGDGAESFADFISRVQNTLENLRNSQHQTITVFSHCQFIRAMMWLILTKQKDLGNDEMKKVYDFMNSLPFPNTAFIKLNLVDEDIYLSPILTNHLTPQLMSY